MEQDPEDWWQATRKAVRETLAKVPHAAERVLGLAVSSQAPTLLPLDRDGRPLRPAIIWMDRRAEAEAVRLAEMLGAEEIHRTTGNRPDAFYGAARLLWLHNHEPEVLKRTWQFAQVNGYINYRLTGRLTIDPAHALLMQMRIYPTGEWSEVLCSACGVDPAQLPEILEGHRIQGEVTVEAAEATGLRAGTPVMAGTVDSPAAALEAGVTEPGIAVEMTGTSTVVIIPNDRGLTEPALIAMPHALPGIHLLLGAMVSSGGSLRWFRDQLGQPEMQAAMEQGADAFDLLTQQAAQVRTGQRGCHLPAVHDGGTLAVVAYQCPRRVLRPLASHQQGGAGALHSGGRRLCPPPQRGSGGARRRRSPRDENGGRMQPQLLRLQPPTVLISLTAAPARAATSTLWRRAKAAPSRMERTSAALLVASERPKNTPRALVCHSGERSPIIYGRKMTPSLPGPNRAACCVSRSNASAPCSIAACISGCPSWSRNQRRLPPEETMAPSSRWIPGRAWGIAINAGSVRPRSLGMMTTVEVPVISTAMPGSVTPASNAAAGLSTVPAITGVPALRPVASAASTVTSP